TEISAMTRQPRATTLDSVRTKNQRPHERSEAGPAERISSGLPHVARSSRVVSDTVFAAEMEKAGNDAPAAAKTSVGGYGSFHQTLNAAQATPVMGAVMKMLKNHPFRIARLIVWNARTNV